MRLGHTLSVLFALAALGACKQVDGLVVVTVTSSQALVGLDHLHVVAAVGTRTASFDVPVGSGIPPEQTFGVATPSDLRGTMHVTVEALAGAGSLASGAGDVEVAPGKRVDLAVQLGGDVGDGGVVDATGCDGACGDFDFTLSPSPIGVAQGKTATLAVMLTRTAGFIDPVSVSIAGLPAGVTASSPTIDGASSAGMITLTAAGSAVIGATADATVTAGARTQMLTVTVRGVPGTLDTSFATSGVGRYDTGNVAVDTSLVVQPDGKPVTAGWYSTIGVLLRTDTAGVLDPGFATGGKLTQTGTFGNYNFGLALQPADASFIMVGNKRTPTSSDYAFVGLHVSAVGVVDAAFAPGAIMSNGNAVTVIADTPDNKILIAGFNTGGPIVVARLHAAGGVDTSFGASSSGIRIIDLGVNFAITAGALAVGPDKSIYLAGAWQACPCNASSFHDVLIAKLTPLGALDTTFGTDGNGIAHYALRGVRTGLGDEGLSIVVQPDNKIVVAGFSVSSVSTFKEFALLRVDKNGVRDPAFGTSGQVTFAVGTKDADARGLVYSPDGKLVLAGRGFNVDGASNSLDFALARVDSSGNLDASFGTAGISLLNAGGAAMVDDEAAAIAIAPDGKYVVSGDSGTSIVLARVWN